MFLSRGELSREVDELMIKLRDTEKYGYLPQVAKLSKTLQTENLDLSIISSLVDATLHMLDDAVLPAANWVLELLDKNNL